MTSNIFTCLNIPECPTLYPNEDEFESPIRYLSSENVLSLGTYYGILKVKPPKGWSPKFALNFDTFKFETRLQELPELSLRNRARVDFLKGFNCYQKFNDKLPLFEEGDLYIGVSKPTIDFDGRNKYGWIHLVDNSRIHIHDIFISRDWQRWFNLASDKKLVSNVIEYSKYIIMALNLERETNLASVTETSFDKFISLSPDTDPHLMKYYKEPNDKNLYLPLNQSLKSAFDNVESFIYNNTSQEEKNDEEEPEETPTLQSHLINIKVNNYTPTIAIISDIQKKEKGKLTFGPTISDEEIKKVINLFESCSICHLHNNSNLLLECDNCGDLYHMTCLTPKLKAIPLSGWYCSICLVGGSGDYGFEQDTKKWSLNEFKVWINENWGNGSMGKHWINSIKRNIDFQKQKIKLTDIGIAEDEMEGLFWSLISGKVELPEGLKIRYGADINNENLNEISGFPTQFTVNGFRKQNGEFIQPNLSTDQLKYVNSEWNLTNLPFAQGSFFKYMCGSDKDEGEKNKAIDVINIYDEEDEIEIDSKESPIAVLTPRSISGMSVPWIYVGGPFSTFCWHKEDHYTMSANYSHLGSPKQWYGVPSECCEEFESRVKDMIGPDIGRKQSDLMHQLVSQIPLEDIYLGDSALRIYKAVQREGEFVITFPMAYHSGFNYGFNVNEAVNFTNVEWMKYSPMAIREYKKVKKEPVFDILDLINNVLKDSENSEKFCEDNWISKEKLDYMKRMSQLINSREIEEIDKIKSSYINEEEEGIKVRQLLNKMKKVSLIDYLKEVGKDQFITKEINEIEGEEEKVDLGICQICKTRVHIEWVDIDMWKDWILKLNEEVRIIEGDIIKLSESSSEESNKIVKMVKVTDGKKIPRMRIKRVKLDIHGPNSELEVKRKIICWLSQKRLMDSGFGHIILCLGCFSEEISGMSGETIDRVVGSSVYIVHFGSV